MSSPRVLDVTPTALRRLEALGPPGALVLSVCFGLDPEVADAATRAGYARDRLDEAARRLEPELPEEEETALHAALRELRHAVVAAVESWPGLRGIAAFADGEGDVLLFRLRQPPVGLLKAAFRERPLIGPLLEAGPGPSWGVLVVDRTGVAVFRGSESALVEVASVRDGVGADPCAMLAAADRRQRFDHLAVIASAETWGQVEACLDQGLRDRLAGHLLEDLPRPSAERVLDRVRPLVAEADRVREAAAWARLEERLADDGRATLPPF